MPVNQHVVWGSAVSTSSSSVSDGTRFLFPHERWVVQAWWECLRQACADTHRLSRESFDYGLVGTQWHQFLLRVDARRHSDGKFLDLADFTRRHILPRLQGLEGTPASACNHRTHNKSYVLVAMRRNGGIWHFRAKTHMPRSPLAVLTSTSSHNAEACESVKRSALEFARSRSCQRMAFS